MPEECLGRDFVAGSRTEMAFDERELVTIAAVVIVTTDPGVDREVMFVSFVTLAGNKLDTGNIGSLCQRTGNELEGLDLHPEPLT